MLEKLKALNLLKDVATKGAEGVHVSGLGFQDKSKWGLARMKYRKRRPGTESEEVKSRSRLLYTVIGIRFSNSVMTM